MNKQLFDIMMEFVIYGRFLMFYPYIVIWSTEKGRLVCAWESSIQGRKFHFRKYAYSSIVFL